jgi:hypothetical protein
LQSTRNKTNRKERIVKILQSVPRQVIIVVLTGFAFVLSGCGQGDKTWLRAMNATPQETEIDVSLNSNSFASNVAYGTTSDYSSVGSGSHTLQIYPPGVATPYIDETISLTAGDKYTVLSANVLSSANTLLLIDETSTPASNTAELRIVNASPVLGTVDVYVVSPGTDLSSVSPTISGLTFEAVSTYQSLTASKAYEVYFTVANQKTAQIDSGPVTYSNAEVRTMVALNGEAGGYTLAILKDLN